MKRMIERFSTPDDAISTWEKERNEDSSLRHGDIGDWQNFVEFLFENYKTPEEFKKENHYMKCGLRCCFNCRWWKSHYIYKNNDEIDDHKCTRSVPFTTDYHNCCDKWERGENLKNNGEKENE